MKPTVDTLQALISDAERRIGSNFMGTLEVTPYMLEQATKIKGWYEEMDDFDYDSASCYCSTTSTPPCGYCEGHGDCDGCGDCDACGDCADCYEEERDAD